MSTSQLERLGFPHLRRWHYPREYYDQLRAVLHDARKHGADAANRDHRPTLRRHLGGLAHVIDASPDGEMLLIDSHVTEGLESAMVRDLPRPTQVNAAPSATSGGWMTILALPVLGGPAPLRLPRSLVPAEAAWIAEF